jgi:endo-alpha-1,4-polygalactosaminidase (GH114 family)
MDYIFYKDHKMITRLIKTVFMALLLVLASPPLSAESWSFYQGDDPAMVKTKIAVLEPDNWNRESLKTLGDSGCKAIAWLNLTQIEESRLVNSDARTRDYVISGRYLPEGMKLAVFYSSAYRSILVERLREYMHKGFAGVALGKVGYYREISDNPVCRSEMWQLIKLLASEAQKIDPAAIVLVHDADDFLAEIDADRSIAGVIAEGLFYGKKGRQVKFWQQSPRFVALKKLAEKGRLVLCAEDARTAQRRASAAAFCLQNGFYCDALRLPLVIERNKSR